MRVTLSPPCAWAWGKEWRWCSSGCRSYKGPDARGQQKLYTALRSLHRMGYDESRRCDLAVLLAGSAANADGSDHISAVHDRKAALDGRRAGKLHHNIASARHRIFESPAWPLEAHGRGSLLLRDNHTSDLRSVHACQINQVRS